MVAWRHGVIFSAGEIRNVGHNSPGKVGPGVEKFLRKNHRVGKSSNLCRCIEKLWLFANYSRFVVWSIALIGISINHFAFVSRESHKDAFVEKVMKVLNGNLVSFMSETKKMEKRQKHSFPNNICVMNFRNSIEAFHNYFNNFNCCGRIEVIAWERVIK